MNSNIIILELEFEYENIKHIIKPVLLRDKNNIILVDCGYEETITILLKKLEELGIKGEEIDILYLTHQDDDHMGAAFELKRRYPNIKIMTSEVEAKYINGKAKNLRLIQGEKFLELLPLEQKEFGNKFCERMKKIKKVNVDKVCRIGDIFEWCGGCEVIDTKGHTPGHTSLYLQKQKILIVGDAAVVEKNDLMVANPQFCLDIKESEKTIERIKKLNVKKYICYHGENLENSL